MDDTPQNHRRWFQYCLPTLLLAVVLFAVVCGWFGVRMQRARRQAEALRAISTPGIAVEYDYQFDTRNDGRDYHQSPGAEVPGPVWLRTLLGDDFFRTVVFVHFDSTTATDADLKHLDGLRQVKSLSLCGTQITDTGLENLKGLSQLRWLLLENTRVTDAGLEHLRGLTQLQQLDLKGTKVTNTGVKKFQQALPKCYIQWDSPGKDERQNRAAPDQPGG